MQLFRENKNKVDAQISKKAMDACELIISEMGAELHDDLIQRLTVLKFSIDRLEKTTSHYPEIEKMLAGIHLEFQEVIQSVRKISRKLMPLESENRSFTQNMMVLCQNLEIPGIGTIHFETDGSEQEIKPLAQTYLCRITQELIHNSFKHSSAWNVWVKIKWAPCNLSIEVEDDGSGFSRLDEFMGFLTRKNSTLKMRCLVIHASICYVRGNNGLLAKVNLNL